MNKDRTTPPSKTSVIIDIDQQEKNHAELEKEISSIPVTDYSDYNITIETKTDYDDALFNSEADLEEALVKSKEEQQIKNNPEPKPTNKIETTLPSVSFNQFFSPKTKQAQTSLQEDTKLRLIDNSLNNSPAKKPRQIAEAGNTFDQVIASLKNQIENEKITSKENIESNEKIAHNHEGSINKKQGIKDLIKTKSLTISKFGRDKLEATKTELDDYLGRNLIERTESLEFILPIISNKDNTEELLSEKSIKKLFSMKGKSTAAILHKCEQQISLITKIKLSNLKKLDLLNIWHPLLRDRIHSVISMYERKPVSKDNEKREKIPSYCFNIMKMLITAYKQLYNNWYESSNLIYAKNRLNINIVAFKLMDSLYLELRLSIAFHYQPVIGSTKTFNKLYYILSLYENEFLDVPNISYATAKEISLNDLFKFYQLALFFQTDTLSSTLHKQFFSYIEKIKDHTSLLPLAISQRLPDMFYGQQILITDQHTDTAATLAAQKINIMHNKQQAILLKVQTAFNFIKQHYVKSLKLKISGNNASSKNDETDNDLMTLAMMNQSIINADNKQNLSNYTYYKPIAISAYCGYSICMEYIDFYYNKKYSPASDDDRPNSEKAKLPGLSLGQWLSAGADKQSLHLQIKENKLGISVDIGELLLLIKTDDADSSESKQHQEDKIIPNEEILLTKIIRMQRDNLGHLNLTAQKLGQEVVHVDMYEKNSTEQEDCKSGIMIINQGRRLLIINKEIRYNSDSQLKLVFPDQTETLVRIDGVTALNNDSQILQLH